MEEHIKAQKEWQVNQDDTNNIFDTAIEKLNKLREIALKESLVCRPCTINTAAVGDGWRYVFIVDLHKLNE